MCLGLYSANVIMSLSLPNCFSLKSRAPELLRVRLTDSKLWELSWITLFDTKRHYENSFQSDYGQCRWSIVLFNVKLCRVMFQHTKWSILCHFLNFQLRSAHNGYTDLQTHTFTVTPHTHIGQVWLPPGYSVCWKSMRQGARGEAGWLTSSAVAIVAN